VDVIDARVKEKEITEAIEERKKKSSIVEDIEFKG
jgi:hypothetical protein